MEEMRPQTLRGIIHVHSDFSFDGLHTLDELVGFVREVGLHFMALTDHAEGLSPDQVAKIRTEAEVLRDHEFTVIPGLEYRCDGDLHILGLGVTDLMPTSDPIDVARRIHERGGVSILAPPARYQFQVAPDLCQVLNGFEVWNAAYDGRFVPPVQSLSLFTCAQAENPVLVGFGGVDLHCLPSEPTPFLEMESGLEVTESSSVLRILRQGQFTIRSKYVRLAQEDLCKALRGWKLPLLRRTYEIARSGRHLAGE